MLNTLKQYLLRRWLVHPPAVWGKLPSHTDYLRYRASAEQAQDWQKWVAEVWARRQALSRTAKTKRTTRPAEPKWVELEPGGQSFDLGAVPVAFILLPGTLGFAPKHFVQGVMVASHDAVGRECPLIIYQLATPEWIGKVWRQDAAARAARRMNMRSNGKQSDHHDQNLLYWLARVVACVHAKEFSADELMRAVDTVWSQFAPGWRQLFGATYPVGETAVVQTLLMQLGVEDELDSANGLNGVQRLPWSQWPDRLLRFENPLPAFWQQDTRGGYVNASDNFPALWKVRK